MVSASSESERVKPVSHHCYFVAIRQVFGIQAQSPSTGAHRTSKCSCPRPRTGSTPPLARRTGARTQPLFLSNVFVCLFLVVLCRQVLLSFFFQMSLRNALFASIFGKCHAPITYMLAWRRGRSALSTCCLQHNVMQCICALFLPAGYGAAYNTMYCTAIQCNALGTQSRSSRLRTWHPGSWRLVLTPTYHAMCCLALLHQVASRFGPRCDETVWLYADPAA